MTSFQRARSDEQREQRRQEILQTAAEMITTTPVAELSLNELSRRVGLAKSNVLRYFESREAVLLELVAEQSEELVQALSVRLNHRPDRRHRPLRRAELVAQAICQELDSRPTLCELVSAQAAVLERNISTDAAAAFKLTSMDQLQRTAVLLNRQLPELDDQICLELTLALMLQISAAWTVCRPAPALQAAYRQHPELDVFQLDFPTLLEKLIFTLIAGALARSGAV